MNKEKIIQTSLLGGFLGNIIGALYEFLMQRECIKSC